MRTGKQNSILLIGGAIVATLALLSRHSKNAAIGKVDRIKRRIYKEVSLAQQAGVDFSKKYADLTQAELDALYNLGQQMSWKQSRRSEEAGKPYTESYYGSLRRAWNAVSGISGIGTVYNVKNADGRIVLKYIEDAEKHYEQEQRLNQMEAELRATRQRIKRRAQQPATIQPEQPKPKKMSKKDLERQERRIFAENFISQYLIEHPSLAESVNRKPFNEDSRTLAEIIVDEFADKKIKTRKSRYDKNAPDVYIYGDWQPYISYGSNTPVGLIIVLLEAWKNKYYDDGFAETDMDEERKALLEKAQHMQVAVPPEDFVVDQDDPYIWYYSDPALVTGDDRYKYLQWINWVVFVHNIYSDTEAFYPVRSYPDRENAKEFARRKYGNNATVKAVWEIDLNKISGIY